MTTTKGKGGVYRTSDLLQQTPRGERAAGARRKEELPSCCLSGRLS
jgi:hypothetical protein